VLNRLTAVWGLALIVAGAMQGVGEIAGGLAVTAPSGLVARALIALGVEAILAAITVVSLRRLPIGEASVD